MRPIFDIHSLAVLAAIAEGTLTETSPISGAPCGPGDPVPDLDAGNCDIPGV